MVKKLFLAFLLFKFILLAHASVTYPSPALPLPSPSSDSASKVVIGFITDFRVGYFNGKQVTVISIQPLEAGYDRIDTIFCGNESYRFENVEGWNKVALGYRRASPDRKTGCHELRLVKILK